jgi:tetratricopeptide (TPR) repeat protein
MKRNRKSSNTSPAHKGDDLQRNATTVGNISGGKGFAIGSGAKAIVVEIGSLFNLGVIFTFIRKYWFFLLINIILQAIAIVLWLKYTNRFLIPIWIFLAGILLLELSILTGFGILTQARFRLRFSLLLAIFIIPLSGIMVSQYNRVINPPKFSHEVFGVAIAQFGEGPDFKRTLKSREISQVVLQQLERQVDENPDLHFVQFRPIGLVKTQAEAIEDGSRIGADLVVWGQLQVSENQTILNFSILETPEKVSNPLFPRILPLYDNAAISFIEVEGQGSEDISKGTTRISAFTFGLAHFFRRDFGAAARAFEEAQEAVFYEGKEDNYHYLIYFYYGLALQRLDKLEQANDQFQKAIDIHPEDPAPWLARAFGNRALGRLEEAQQDARIAFNLCSDRIQLEPEDYVAYYDRAHASEILQDWDAARFDFEMVTEKAPDLYIGYISLARAQIKLNQLEEALRSSQAAIKLAERINENPAWAYMYLGYTYKLLGDVDNARLSFKAAITKGSDVDYLHYQYAQFLESTGNPDDLLAAEEEYQTNIILNSNKALAHSTLADFYARHDRLDEAIVEYRFALQYDQDSANLWTGLANVYSQLNKEDEALDAYKHALEVGPENFFVQASFGNFLLKRGELESAIEQYEIARGLDPENCGLYLNLGLAYDLLDDKEQSEVFYQLAFSSDPQRYKECQAEAAERLMNFVK